MSEYTRVNCTRCGSEIPAGVTHFCGSGFLNPSDEVESLRTQLQEAQEGIERLSKRLHHHGMKVWKWKNIANERGQTIHATQVELAKSNSKLAAAEEELARLEKDRGDLHMKYLVERSRLTAEVEEYKKMLTDLKFPDGGRVSQGAINAMWDDYHGVLKQLHALRRSSVRVDVLLKWIQSRSRVLSILGGSIMSRAGSNPGEQAKALLSWLTAVLDKRQSRPTNTKGE